jgi:hypothetical protein
VADRAGSAAYAGIALAELLIGSEPERARALVKEGLAALDPDPIHNPKREQAAEVLAALGGR